MSQRRSARSDFFVQPVRRVTHRGSLAGLRIDSDFPLIGLAAPPASHEPLGRLAIRRVTPEEIARCARADPLSMSMQPGQPGSFLVTGPDEILVAPAPGAADRSIFAFAFGPCFAVIAYLNRVLPLHASAIETAHGCVGFLGQSGAGKSTMVAALSTRGHVIHSDDLCLVRRMPDARILSWPGIRWLRLNADAAAAFQFHGVVPAPSPTGRKHTLTLAPLIDPITPREPRAVYVLEGTARGETPSMTRLRGARAAERLMANAYRPQLARRLGLWPQVVLNCVAFAERVPVYVLRRALDFAEIPGTLDFVERHIELVAAERPS